MKYLKPIFESNEDNYMKELKAFLVEFEELFNSEHEHKFKTYSNTGNISDSFRFNNFDEMVNNLDKTKWFTELFNIEIKGKFSGRIPKLMFMSNLDSYKKRLDEYYTNFSNTTSEIKNDVSSIVEHFNGVNKVNCDIQIDEIRYNENQYSGNTNFNLLFLCSIKRV